MRVYLFLALLVSGSFASAQALHTTDTELFIEIRDAGKYTVTVEDDYIASRNGRFRFYELRPGTVPIIISNSGKEIYRKNLAVPQGMRTLLTYSKREGLKITGELAIYQFGRYALDNWNGSLVADDDPRGNRPGRQMDAQDFSNLFTSLKKESFDDGKVKFLSAVLRNNRVSVSQLVQLLGVISFEDNRLKAAMNSYNYVYDRGNFYLVRNVLSFSSNRDKLDSFLSKQG